ncbi:DUF1538 domain-containing protein [Lunatibacter salilacus]|uniref:DUF1538 domain-containing protein n=1 Tax=Lunatibacter salilacus TaxID=2483804 RepID=UPI00131E0747|nr:DUF1538 domain-containing protein [Lunatibacter salilacus]
MDNFSNEIIAVLMSTVVDVLPILILILGFQLFVLKKPIPQLRKVVIGSVYVVLGLAMFLLGLEKALFPIGNMMAEQLSNPEFLGIPEGQEVDWKDYYWIYLFAAMIGFSTTIAEPSLIAVAIKADEVSSGTISRWGLRLTVACGVSLALAVGTYRIITGTPIYLYIMTGYLVVIVQTLFAPKHMIPLAYDSGGVTTSTVTVPLVAALGLGLSATIPGRNPAVDGFGLIAFASVFPIITVLGYAQLTVIKKKIVTLKQKRDAI